MRNSLPLCLLKSLTARAGIPLLLLATGTVVAAATPEYVQGNYAVPQTSQSSVSVPYEAVQTSGNLNVVIVGWNDSASHITSVKDTKGNVYQLAVGPTVTGSISQDIYYAKNITAAAAATNAITVTFNTPAVAADIRVLEYSGLDPISPLDTFVGQAGNSGTSSSGAVITTSVTDLLVAANTVQSSTAGAGSGFTQRLLTRPDGDIAEDEIVTTAGTYTASTTLTGGGGWVMQTVAFRASSSPTAAPLATAATGGSSVTLAWNADAATTSSATNTTGYRLHMGTARGVYTQTLDVGKVTTAKVSSLKSGTTYYCAVTAYNSAGTNSSPSQPISFVAK